MRDKTIAQRVIDQGLYRIVVKAQNFEEDGRTRCIWVDFEIYSAVGWDDKKQTVLPFEHKEHGAGNWKHTTDHTEAKPEISGSTKWDGCTQWQTEHTHLDLDEPPWYDHGLLGEKQIYEGEGNEEAIADVNERIAESHLQPDPLPDLEELFDVIRTAIQESRKELKP